MLSQYEQTVFETIQDGVIVVDISGKIQSVNGAAEKITGYRAEELVGQSCRILDCTDCKIFGDKPGGPWCGLFVRGKVREKRCRIRAKDGSVVQTLKNGSIIRDKSGNVVGAVEILTDISETIRKEAELESLKQALDREDAFHGIIGRSSLMKNLFELIESVARTDTPVMIEGESGTGKELVAKAIHDESPRRDMPFIKVNCAALNENLLESELFGHVKGSFSGAGKDRIGRFEAAHQGTIFLDEIGELPLSTQVKLLRVLEEKIVERVGDHRPIPVDARIITATNKNLEHLIDQGLLREDFYFRIHVFPLLMPPLKARPEDIPLLVNHFIRKNVMKGVKEVKGLARDAMEAIMAYPWPGNVRELRNAVEYAMVLCPEDLIRVDHLPQKVIGNSIPKNGVPTPSPSGQGERDALMKSLQMTGGNRSEAAKILGVSRVTVWKRMKKYGLI